MISFIVCTIVILLALGVPVAYAIGLSSAGAIYFFTKTPLLIVIQKMFAQLDSFPLLAVPFFILAGTLMDRGGISRKLIDFDMAENNIRLIDRTILVLSFLTENAAGASV